MHPTIAILESQTEGRSAGTVYPMHSLSDTNILGKETQLEQLSVCIYVPVKVTFYFYTLHSGALTILEWPSLQLMFLRIFLINCIK